MNVLEKILEEIEDHVNMVKNIPINEDDDFLDGEECYEAGRVQGRYEELLWCRNMIRSHMDDDLCTNTKNNMDEMASIDSAIKILRNMQNPRIDYADMVGAPVFCYGKRYVFPEQEDYAIETALIALNEKKARNTHRNNVVESNMYNKCPDCSRRKWYQKGYEDSKKDNGWIPYTLQNIPKKEGVYLVTCDDEEYPVKRMRFKKEDEYGLWYDDYGIYDGVIFAWQPLPKPYKMKENK